MSIRSMKKTSKLVLIGWLLLIIYVSLLVINLRERPQNDTDDLETAQQIRTERAARKIENVQKENSDIEKIFSLAQPKLAHFSAEHEGLRRKIDNGILELYFSTSTQLTNLASSLKGSAGVDLESILAVMSTQFHMVMADALRLAEVDGAGSWREKRLMNLSNLMHKRLKALQNPPDCAKARKLLCTLNKGCGFGCQLHHVAYCFIVAYATERTLILVGDGQDWSYSLNGWTTAFLPVSETCSDKNTAPAKPWSSLEDSRNHLVISLPIVDELRNAPPFLPQSFPKDLAADLLHLHGYPPVWFIGHFIDHLMRGSPQLEKILTLAEKKINFESGPVVGMQIRRTDKIGSEAAFHSVEEYIEWADHWFAIQSLKHGKPLRKRIFVATDEPEAINQMKKFKDYDIFADSKIASSAQEDKRYTNDSLFGVITDIRMLSKCDYLVCTFSSQVCRLAYELMQVNRGDAAANFHSLDDIYYYGGQHASEREAILPHSPNNKEEIELQVGDTIFIAGNHWNGMSKGHNKRTDQLGLYPSYKVKEKWRIEEFPSYPNIKI